jgi:transcriptional accessory protein Tex/SPT6
MNIIEILASEFGLKVSQVENTVALIDEGNTIPFIARYRKEVTGGMSDEVLRDLDERLTYLRNLEERKEEVIRLIDEQGKLTDELKEKIIRCINYNFYLVQKEKLILEKKGLERQKKEAILKSDISKDEGSDNRTLFNCKPSTKISGFRSGKSIARLNSLKRNNKFGKKKVSSFKISIL